MRAGRKILFAIRLPNGYDPLMDWTDLDNLIRILELIAVLIALAKGTLDLADRVKKRKR